MKMRDNVEKKYTSFKRKAFNVGHVGCLYYWKIISVFFYIDKEYKSVVQ